MEESSTDETPWLTQICLSSLLTSWIFVDDSMSCLTVSPDTPIFEFGNLISFYTDGKVFNFSYILFRRF